MKEKYIDSSSRRDRLHLYIWMPKDQPKPGLIVQMTHGMVEHMGRYEELAQYLNAHGIGAIGHDTLGHGKSAQTSSQFGFFAKKNGDRCLVTDVARVTACWATAWDHLSQDSISHSMARRLMVQF